MKHVLVKHKVTDFTTWKTFYDADKGTRENAGIREEQLMRNTKDPNEVVILFEAKDEKKAQEFTSSPELKEAMEKAGVIGMPDIMFLN